MVQVPQVVVFDVNETLSDLTPLGNRFEEAGLPAHLMPVWFAGVLRDGFALTVSGAYADFADVAADVLRDMLSGADDRHKDVEAVVRHVLDGFGELRCHPDVAPGMRRLCEAGIRLFTLTNGAAALTERLLESEGLLALVERRLDVSAPRAWKPSPAAYQYVAGEAGVRPELMALAAVHPWDVDGAQRAGLVGAWLNRGDKPYPRVMAAPRVQAPSLPALATELLQE
ncbi:MULTISPECIES: haloacid dehalogenase type II [unclassified Nocardiopsis]|uniref:haloacid dehalogenase type II n=1 Tax=unclassified Nocardiopsis TaxID=2649073 RepID=UPI00135A3EF7|nr:MULTISPECIES: haloacid dehalogenase type II [unclassified Nocardiopsis]